MEVKVEAGNPVSTIQSLFWLEIKYTFSETSSGKGQKRRETEYLGIVKYVEDIDKRKLVIIIGFL